MKILHLGKYFFPFSGGLENYMRDAMVALARRGITSVALVHQHSLSLGSTDESLTVSGQQFRVIRSGMWARVLYTPVSPAFPWHLRRLIKIDKPDILHLHMPNPSVFWTLVLPSARRIPWVVHWHSDVITSAQGGWMRLAYTLYKPFEQAVLKRAKTIICTSPPYRDTSEPLKMWLDKCRVVPLGVDAERYSTSTHERDFAVGSAPRRDLFSRSERSMNNRGEDALAATPPLEVLAVGRLTYYKGFRHLVEAVALAENIHVDLVGAGEQSGYLRELVDSLHLEDRVRFHGSLGDMELAELMRNCDCLCLPSIERTEAFGMVLLEAMLFGKATVISDVEGSGMGWVVDDGVTGIKVKPGDAEALAEALRYLAEHRNELHRMGQQGKAKFDRQFEINHAVAELVQIYQTALQTKNNDDQEQQVIDVN